MCRLFCWSSTHDVSPQDVLGSDSELLVNLSSLHKDGWGSATLEGDRITTVRDTFAANQSPDFEKYLAKEHTRHGMIHLRWATGAYAICKENTHPFMGSDVAFQHNGGFDNAESLIPLIDDDLLATRQGDVDSELYFLYLQTLLRTMNLKHAYEVLIPFMERETKYTSLNAMMLTSSKLHVVSAYSQNRRPADVEDDYYELAYQDVDGVFSAWSSGVRNEPGTELPNNHILTIDLKSHEISIEKIDLKV